MHGMAHRESRLEPGQESGAQLSELAHEGRGHRNKTKGLEQSPSITQVAGRKELQGGGWEDGGEQGERARNFWSFPSG